MILIFDCLVHKETYYMLPNNETNGIISPKSMNITGTINEIKKEQHSHSILKETTNPLQALTDIIGRWVKEEETLIKLTFLVLMSAYLPIPLNLAIEGPPSEGKSYPLLLVAEAFPEEDLIIAGGMSRKSLPRERGTFVDINDSSKDITEEIKVLSEAISQAQGSEAKIQAKAKLRERLENSAKLVDLQGKVFLFTEAPDEELLAELRPILSRDSFEIRYAYVDKPSANAPMVTMKAILRGFPVFMFATADAPQGRTWEQIHSRFIVVSPKMSKIKYKKGNEVTAHIYGSIMSENDNIQEKELLRIKEYFRSIKKILMGRYELIKEHRDINHKRIRMAWNPMYLKLQKVFPSNVGQNMRDFRDFMVLMEASACLSIYQRPNIIVKDMELTWVTMKDLQIVLDIYKNYHIFIKESEVPLDFYERVFIPLEENEANHDKRKASVDGIMGFTRESIQEAMAQVLGISPHVDNITKYYLKPLMNLGLITEEKMKSDKRSKVWYSTSLKISDLADEDIIGISYSFTDLLEALKQQKIIDMQDEKAGPKIHDAETKITLRGLFTESNSSNPTMDEIYTNHYHISINSNDLEDLNGTDNGVEKAEVTLSAKSDISEGERKYQKENTTETVIKYEAKLVWDGCDGIMGDYPIEKLVSNELKVNRIHRYGETVHELAMRSEFNKSEIRNTIHCMINMGCIKVLENEPD